MDEVEAVMAGNVCTSDRKAACAEEMGHGLAAECARCGAIKSIDPFTGHILNLRQETEVQGRHYDIDDLTCEEWDGLGVVEALTRKPRAVGE